MDELRKGARLTMASDADLLLRRFIVALAERVIASNVYSGGEYELANFLAAYVYDKIPGDIREVHNELEKAAASTTCPSVIIQD